MKSISGKRLIQILLGKGWQVIRIKGSHYRLKRENVSVSIPVHANQDIKIGLLKSIMRLTGLLEEDLI